MNSASSSEIEFVYFDLGNVLVSFDPEQACRNLADRFDVSTSLAHAAIYDSGLQQQYEQGQVSSSQYADAIRDQLKRDADQMPTAAVLDAVSDMFAPIETMRGVLIEARRRGFRIGLLSNTCHAHWTWIMQRQYVVADGKLDAVVLSYEVGAMKPSEVIYREAQRAAGVPGDRILFLDDRAENVAAARRHHWRCEQCIGGPQAIDVLRSFGVIGDAS